MIGIFVKQKCIFSIKKEKIDRLLKHGGSYFAN